MTFIKYRKEDRHRLKYLMPYGYMRRHLAKAYSFRVEGGEFVRRRILESDIAGFSIVDILPLGVVMAMQRAFERKANVTDQVEEETKSLKREVEILRNEFTVYKMSVECELERLSVECMRLQILNERNCSHND